MDKTCSVCRLLAVAVRALYLEPCLDDHPDYPNHRVLFLYGDGEEQILLYSSEVFARIYELFGML